MAAAADTTYTSHDDFLASAAQRGEVVGSWGFSSNTDFTRMAAEETNVWFFEQAFNFLRAFFGVVMPDQLELMTYNASKQVKRENLDQMTFLDELMLIMKNLKEPLWVLKLNLSIVGFIRADWDPDNQVRVRIQEPASFICWGGADESGFQTFSIGFNLFSSQQIKSQGISVWSVNQPLLEKALKKWEAQTGKRIDVVQGNSPDLSLGQHGFNAPAPTSPRHGAPPPPRPRAIPPPVDLPPGDDWLPDLDDLKF